MWRDEIVEETRKAREEYAARFNYNLEAIYRDLVKQQEQSPEKFVSLPSKPFGLRGISRPKPASPATQRAENLSITKIGMALLLVFAAGDLLHS